MTKHSMDVRVYYEDTDAGGVVYHGNYLNFGERGRTEFLRDVGFENKKLADSLGIIFVVRHVEIDYLKPAHLDDLLTQETAILELKNSSFVMSQKIFRDGEPISDMRVVLVCVETENYTPVRLPENVKEAFQGYMNTVE